MDIRDKILEAKANKGYIYIPAAHPYRMDWNEFISLLEKDPVQYRELTYDKFDFTVPNSTHNEKLKDIYLYFKNYLDLKLVTIKTLANVVGDEGEYWVHPDSHDVITFQLFGKTEYRIFKDVPESRFHIKNSDGLIYKSYIMNPGDIMYMTKGTVHQAVMTGPRITAILDIYNF